MISQPFHPLRAVTHVATQVLALGVLLVLGALPALAGIEGGDGEFGIDIGVTDFQSDVTGTDDTGLRLGLRGGYLFTDLFELEGQLGRSKVSNDPTAREIVLWTAMVNAVFNFHPSPTVVPYVLVGGGIANVEVDGVAGGPSMDDSDLAWQVGGGSRFFFGRSKRGAFRVEATYLEEEAFGDSNQHVNLTVGLTWRLGR